jgi:hypothetical protein
MKDRVQWNKNLVSKLKIFSHGTIICFLLLWGKVFKIVY